MRRIIFFILAIVSILGMTTNVFSQEITVRFTGQLNGTGYCRLDRVAVVNVTRNWTEMVEYPDTIIVLGGTVGANLNIAAEQGLGQNIPNPFDCETRVELSVSQREDVRMQLLDVAGKVYAEYNASLDAGMHIFDISAANPQTYLLHATVGNRQYSIRMVNVGSGCGCSIKYAGSSNGIVAKLTSTNEFQIGDNMRYVGYATFDGETVASAAVEHTQTASEDITLNFTVCLPVAELVEIMACDSYQWNSESYTESGEYQQTFTATNGCDSIVTLLLTINHSNTGVDEQTACDSYTWIDGETYTESTNEPTFTLTNAEGCDSVVTLHLTVNHSNTGVDEQTACDSYTWIDGITYTESTNEPTFTLTNANGCDSVVTLHLTINHSNTGVDEQTACESYTWIDGITYTESTNEPTYTLTSAVGCDSVVTLHLTINHSNTGIDEQTTCDSYTWIDGETYTESTNEPTFTLTNAGGCDSVVVLHLTINHSNTGLDEQTACDSYTWIDGETYTESTNEPTFTLINANGCDSVVTLHLTINHSNTGIDEHTACDSYTWIDGETYTESTNEPTFTLTNAEGCDSVVVLHLTITHSNTGVDEQTACDSYTWIDGNTYTASTNEPTFTLTNAEGCDSVVTLHLTVNHSNTGIDEQTACDSYTWINGETYTESTNEPTYTLTNVAGCDSVVTLHLTINHSNTGIDEQTACESYTWIDGNTYTASTNEPTFTLTNAAGCDSLVTLHLAIVCPPTVETVSASNITYHEATLSGNVRANGGASVTARGFMYGTSANNLTQTVQSGSGTGSYTKTITGLNPNTTYYYKAYATNSVGTAYGEVKQFATCNCGGTYKVTDVNGNQYGTVLIGEQCWMAENLRATKFADGTNISLGSSTSSTTAYRYYPNNSSSNISTYGYLYNWKAAMHGASSSSTNPSNVQGVCPNGWHLPSDAEWQQLKNYVMSQNQYWCGSASNKISKAMSSTTGWDTSTGTCVPGNDLSANNATGFSALPAGDYNGSYNFFRSFVKIWSATQEDDTKAYNWRLNKDEVEMYRRSYNKTTGYSVRCVKNE